MTSCDFNIWSNHGLKYSKELLKDFIKLNGLPLPGVKIAIESFGLSVKTAQDWGCINIGEFISGGLACIDSGLKIKKYISGKFDSDIKVSDYSSLIIKYGIATSTTNPIIAASVFSDVTILLKRAWDQSFEDNFNFEPINNK